ncbi:MULTISPECIES: ComF family protein [Pseudomonas]|uniref:ComF family protein n=1 Tax=Pseudomonas TaxID=286 RepID=UPI0021143E4B|nr:MULTISPECIES: phosphoribosyltransferase family protein [Pseudomonas]
MNSPPAFNQIVAPFLYGFPVDSLILAFKHHHQLTYGRMLALLLLDAVRFHYRERHQALPDCLIPMPLHGARLAKRGFNQAMELTRPLARRLTIPVEHGVLLRQRATQTQQGLDARARRRNLKDAFICRKPERILGKHIALVEDVVTTGTTVREASRVLLDAGAASVSVWCVARTDA